MEERVQTFLAKDSNGHRVVLSVWREVCSLNGQLTPGATRIATRDGRTVERKEKGQYELAETRERIIADSPDAP